MNIERINMLAKRAERLRQRYESMARRKPTASGVYTYTRAGWVQKGKTVMAYKRKTRDYWELQGNYGHGWECLTAEETYREISQRRKEYRENEGGSYRIVCKREPITEAQCSRA